MSKHPQFARSATNTWKVVAGVFVVGWAFKWGMYYHTKGQMDRISEMQEQKLHDHFAAENLKSAPMEGIDMDRVNTRVDEQLKLWAQRDAASATQER